MNGGERSGPRPTRRSTIHSPEDGHPQEPSIAERTAGCRNMGEGTRCTAGRLTRSGTSLTQSRNTLSSVSPSVVTLVTLPSSPKFTV